MIPFCLGWVLRRPKQFLEELMERVLTLMSGGNNQEMELVTQVSVCVCVCVCVGVCVCVFVGV